MQPNIFLILLDSLRIDHVYGNEKSSITPNLNLLVSQGTNFTDAFSTADHTGVSWLSIISSLFPINSKIYLHPHYQRQTLYPHKYLQYFL